MNLFRLLFRLFMGRRLPITHGQLPVPGMFGRIRIHRDRHGIPLIEADDPRDGPFAIGFCQGQDRAFQLELLLRVAQGTVAEMVGPGGLPVDRLSRRIGFARAAREQWPVLDADIRESLEAYSRGVQAGVTVGCPRPPHEFALLGIRPTPWTPVDTLAVTKLLSFTLTANWDAELVRFKVLTTDGLEALKALNTSYPPWQPVASPVGAVAGSAVDRLVEDLNVFFSWVRPGGGSNNWVVAGSRAATGRPILANDPHLDASLPAHWYLLSLRTPRETLVGASFVGGPTVLVGHNAHAAWGLTAGLVDNTDLFLEEIGPDGASVRKDDGFVACPVIDETIAVKGSDPVVERVLITPRGPIISPALTQTPQALSLRATWLDPLPVRGFFHFPPVKSFAEFRAAFAHWPLSAQNLVYADTSGAIGWQLIGRAPKRRKGNGTLPLPGWDSEVGWEEEPVPYEDMPHSLNPSCNFIATANTQPVPEGQGPFLGRDFLDGYRLIAIQRALQQRQDWDVAGIMKLQMDQYSVVWEQMREVVLSVSAQDANAVTALDLLRNWDGRLSADSPAAAVFELFVAEMLIRLVKTRAPLSWSYLLGGSLSPVTPYNFVCFRRMAHLIRLLGEQPTGWFARPWPEEIADALSVAVGRLQRQFGSDPALWAWGTIRPLVLHHPLSRRPGLLGRALARVFNLGPVPCGGDANVINQAAAFPLMPLAPSDNIASLRAVIDVGHWHNSRFVLPGGQSGNPLSPHYGDLFELWQRGEGVPIAFTPDEVRAAAVQTLELHSSGP